MLASLVFLGQPYVLDTVAQVDVTSLLTLSVSLSIASLNHYSLLVDISFTWLKASTVVFVDPTFLVFLLMCEALVPTPNLRNAEY